MKSAWATKPTAVSENVSGRLVIFGGVDTGTNRQSGPRSTDGVSWRNDTPSAVAPGPIDSEGAARASVSRGSLSGTDAESIREGYRKRIALGRFGAPDEVARLVLFLACDASSFITGTTVLVDGGASLT